MTKIIELAHALGEEIAKSDEIKNLNATKDVFDANEELQAKMREYEAERLLLGQEFAKENGEADEKAIANLKANYDAEIASLQTQITANKTAYSTFKSFLRTYTAKRSFTKEATYKVSKDITCPSTNQYNPKEQFPRMKHSKA